MALPQRVQDQLTQERKAGVFSLTYDLDWNPPLIQAFCDCEMKKKNKPTLFIYKEFDGRRRSGPGVFMRDLSVPDSVWKSASWNGSLKQIEEQIEYKEKEFVTRNEDYDKKVSVKDRTNTQDNELINLRNWIGECRDNIVKLKKFLVKCPAWSPRREVVLRVSYNDKNYEHIAAQMGNYPQLEPLFEKMRAYKVRVDEINRTRKNPRRNCHAEIVFKEDTMTISDVSWEIWRHDKVHSY